MKISLKSGFFLRVVTFFDRGHLTRRVDPSWGTEQEALRADADTFHFQTVQFNIFDLIKHYSTGRSRTICT
jgi:endonuclease G